MVNNSHIEHIFHRNKTIGILNWEFDLSNVSVGSYGMSSGLLTKSTQAAAFKFLKELRCLELLSMQLHVQKFTVLWVAAADRSLCILICHIE